MIFNNDNGSQYIIITYFRFKDRNRAILKLVHDDLTQYVVARNLPIDDNKGCWLAGTYTNNIMEAFEIFEKDISQLLEDVYNTML